MYSSTVYIYIYHFVSIPKHVYMYLSLNSCFCPYLSLNISIYLYIPIDIYRYVCLSIYLPILLSACLSVCLPVCLSIRLFITTYLPISAYRHLHTFVRVVSCSYSFPIDFPILQLRDTMTLSTSVGSQSVT